MEASRICRMDGSAEAVRRALAEAESFAAFSGLEGREAIHLRMFAEELIGVATALTNVREGSFHIEREGGDYRLKLEVKTDPLGKESKRKLLKVSRAGENESYRGVGGLLCRVTDWYLKGQNQAAMEGGADLRNGFRDSDPRDREEWSLRLLQERREQEDRARDWDELEMSVLSRLADDVRIGYRYDTVVITVCKAFEPTLRAYADLLGEGDRG